MVIEGRRSGGGRAAAESALRPTYVRYRATSVFNFVLVFILQVFDHELIFSSKLYKSCSLALVLS